jgi:hypothetical protein
MMAVDSCPNIVWYDHTNTKRAWIRVPRKPPDEAEVVRST